MAERRTAARPYAEAVFALAHERERLTPWSQTLAAAAAVARDPRVARLMGDPRIPRASVAQLFIDTCRPDDAGANFLRLLAENRRLALLPEIAALYEERKAAAEARVDATVTAAFALEAAELKKIEAALARRLGRAVRLSARVDPSLLGGLVIRAGDLVIDGSVRGRLAALAAHLSH